MSDFLPAIISVAFLAAAFLYGFLSDMYRIRRLDGAYQPARKATSQLGYAKSPKLG